MPRQKILIIDRCNDCPDYNFDDQDDPDKWGKSWCDKLNIELPGNDPMQPIPIPENCPLRDYGGTDAELGERK